ncbi:hypothetical protein [Ferrimicrobium acidiphilum]|uniref:hypothetical protein n=1 Tax=Ferrimicrobium acidiphilum TaxID=121039 RepID=UPI0023F29537|nr:hypothetical protein [Ferrimicrobium acidiphilum]
MAITAADLEVDLGIASLAHGIALYSKNPPSHLGIDSDETPLGMFERLIASGVPDADTYFSCLAALHKGRLKYERILSTQAIPTIDQVGPRGLLLYGMVETPALAALLLWRKWIFDIDNRAGQETGYVFEPILAGAIGGAPATASTSPVRREADPTKGRQVDCILDNIAYEFKLRVTIAASGQGRWGEELQFPADCAASCFKPALIVLDPTDDPKLEQLQKAFEAAGGMAYIGDDAWEHLKTKAGQSMGTFVDRYIRTPLEDLLKQSPSPEQLPNFSVQMGADAVKFCMGQTTAIFYRSVTEKIAVDEDDDQLPDDISDQLPGL